MTDGTEDKPDGAVAADPGGNPWSALRRHTAARIALGRSGDGLPTRHLLDFQLAHARARDAVHLAFEPEAIAAALPGHVCVTVRSRARDRAAYLQYPDLGRKLDPEDLPLLRRGEHDVVFVLADGLSARAVHDHAAALLTATLGLLPDWRVAPVVLARQARVALGDDIAMTLGAAAVVMLIGERPGLSAADSLGAYLTFRPRPNLQNADRNCVSNIRPDGLAIPLAARKLAFLLTEARRLKLSGVGLKDDFPAELLEPAAVALEATRRD
ncbi:ethanolamine ammonia-lyase small subunit [Skermanella stibiiresistens SB22]|uniref:Ethanolamine ammonia-lyase small subunit n=1 Tax=Skermanella stibiiresistens SB22 TaxID=1385369 RepID=W9GUZ2_9PROT|nr:ethanolamine ammonia-lyase subunit EutC [Skermanella stibiiresistens]EWY36486.1 ethanolamine ammonia-lyase small subunit [Skermanella stibiiresistens SB22]